MKKIYIQMSVAAIVVGVIMYAVLSSDAQRGFRGPRGEASELEKPPVPKDDYERKILAVLDDIYENQRFQNVPKENGRVLRLFAESMNAKNVVEIGTSTGISAIWLGMALRKN